MGYVSLGPGFFIDLLYTFLFIHFFSGDSRFPVWAVYGWVFGLSVHVAEHGILYRDRGCRGGYTYRHHCVCYLLQSSWLRCVSWIREAECNFNEMFFLTQFINAMYMSQ